MRRSAPWRNFAVLYRKHTHREQLLDALRRKRHSFRHPQIFDSSSTIVRDLLAYLRLIVVPGGQRGLRARAGRSLLGSRNRAIWCASRSAPIKITGGRSGDELETAQSEAPFNRSET